MCRFVHNNKIVLFCCPDDQRKRHYSSTRVYWTRWPLYTSLGPYCWTDFSVQREESHSWASPWKIHLCGWHNESRTQQINTAPSCWLSPTQKKKRDPAPSYNVALMATIFSLFYKFDSFSLCWISRRLCRLYTGGVCVYTHRPYKRWVRLTDSLFFFIFFGGDPFKLAQKRLFDSRQRKGSTLSVKIYRTLHTEGTERERERGAPCVPIYLNSAAHNWHNVPVWKTMNSPTLFSS